MMPTPVDGMKWWTGKKKPVTLVKTVVVRNQAVQLSSRLFVSKPKVTTIPVTIPIRLIRT
jgi:hypothetical protein